MMDISPPVVGKCDALLLIGDSPGAKKERALILSNVKKVFYSIYEISEVKI